MKRILFVVLTLFLTGCTEESILDCKGNENVAGVCIDSTPPQLSGIDDIEIELNAVFDPLFGVSAIDDLDGDITESITVTENINTNRPGTYLVKYEVEDSFLNKTYEIRYVIVTRSVDYGTNMIFNGSFQDGLEGWSIYRYDEAYGEFSVIDESLVVTVQNIDTDVWYSPRLDFPDLYVQQGEYYKITFDAKADIARHILVQVGELLPANPWYVDLATNINKVYYLTDETQTYEIIFRMEQPTNMNASLIFEMGDVLSEHITTNIYIDNITFTKITEEQFLLENTKRVPGTIEAEDYDSMFGVEVEDSGDTHGNQNVGWISDGDWLSYNIVVEEEGDYIIFSRLASPSDNKSMTVLLDGEELFTINIPNTGDWHNYLTVSSGILHLEEGPHELKIITDTGGFNINYLNFEKVN